MTIYLLLITLLITILWSLIIYRRQRYFLHMFQLEGYKVKQYIPWLKHNIDKVFDNNIIIVISGSLGILFFIFLSFLSDYVSFIFLPFFLLAGLITVFRYKEEKVKKPLVMTSRAKRLLAISILINVFTIIGFFILISSYKISDSNIIYFLTPKYLLLFILSLFWTEQIVSINIIISSVLLIPIENLISKYYVNIAKVKLNKLSPLVIGITGSYGKTSCKYFLNTILENKYKVLMTPGSFNTPMGICKVINNDLNETHEIFISEMGARRTGEIKEIADFVKPKIGLITSIGEQHLETFGSLKNIIKTKYELIEALPNDGIAVFNYDNEHCKKLSDSTTKRQIINYGLNNENTKLNLFAKDIKYVAEGMEFIVVNDKGEEQIMNCRLLGVHNISNILSAIAIAQHLGMSLSEIAPRITQIKGIEHRLELIKSPNGSTIIDDTFNSNPEGVKAALNVLSLFESNSKILVTPGMIELGEKEAECNEEFGKIAGNICNHIILIGKKRAEIISRGVKASGFNMNNCFMVNNLDEATEKLKYIVSSESVILFENDLPDNYNE